MNKEGGREFMAQISHLVRSFFFVASAASPPKTKLAEAKRETLAASGKKVFTRIHEQMRVPYVMGYLPFVCVTARVKSTSVYSSHSSAETLRENRNVMQ